MLGSLTDFNAYPFLSYRHKGEKTLVKLSSFMTMPKYPLRLLNLSVIENEKGRVRFPFLGEVCHGQVGIASLLESWRGQTASSLSLTAEEWALANQPKEKK